MRKRLITTFILIAVGLPSIILGGVLFYIFIGTFLIGAAWEYVQLFRAAKFEPNLVVTVGGVAALTFARTFVPAVAPLVLTIAVLAAMTVHLVAYEHGRDQAALDFSVAVGGVVYIGWLGSYLFDLRNLPEGGWWFMLVMLCVWLGDSGAYSIGRAYGKHKMTPRLSPKKSWEGYAASILTGAIAGGLYVWVFQTFAEHLHNIAIWQGALMGLIIGILATLGDLGESMLKRQSGLKDSSGIMPGHGGFFDRIDSWLWGAAIGYYFLIFFII
ncbi:MAG: phosphatidate cytidylyltransferase [Anaerolineales bacterium]|nr:phosphatidate cytidylyltransferase [Anaerolineales bacterium]